MFRQNIDGSQLKKMIISGANNLENNKKMVNALNIFPVPDGDTGTNMALTMSSAIKEIKDMSGEEYHSVFEVVANGTLMGARGNSGVILSQIFRGFAKGIKDSEELNSVAIAQAFQEGSNTAYKAIMKPTEGTILTVIRETAEYAVNVAENYSNIIEMFEETIRKANEVLDKTPDMLPVLKNAGVVDAGGKGLICILDGMLYTLKTGELIELEDISYEEETIENPIMSFDGEIAFSYCTEFFILGKNIDYDSYKYKIIELGDSLVVVGDENLVKIHIHTNNPGRVLEIALEYGELSKIKIDNMKEQHRQLLDIEEAKEEIPVEEHKEYAIITVAMGEGIARIFKDIGADVVIEGGQTMNPSTEDMVNSINRLNSNNIIILPNNSNIILAADQAKNLVDKNVIVAQSKTIPQGIAALMALDYDKNVEDNLKKINRAINGVKTGQVTYAVRNSSYNDIEIQEGNILGLQEGKIKNVGENVLEVCKNILAEMIDEDSSLVSIYYGNELKKEDAQLLYDYVEANYPECEIDMHEGAQPLYFYILSVE